MSVTPEQHDRTVPADWTAPAYLVLPKYSKRELQFLAARLQESNFELRQQLFRLREELRRTERTGTDEAQA